MKWVAYIALVLVAGALFLPESGSIQIRNLPILLGLIGIVVVLYLFRISRYVFFMMKAKKMMEKNGLRLRKTRFNPLFSMLRGGYSMSFRGKKSDVHITFMVARYPHYFFENVNLVKFYKHKALVIAGGHNKSLHTVSGENKLVGKQKLLWADGVEMPHNMNILLFNRFPAKVTDSVKRQELGNGDSICGSDKQLFDWDGFCRYMGMIQ